MLQQRVDRQKIRHLLDFIGAYLPFEEKDFLHKLLMRTAWWVSRTEIQWIEVGIEQNIQQITKSRQAMGIREAILNEVKEQGVEQGIKEKERIVVTRGWKRGMTSQDIADLADMPVEPGEAIIRELEQ